MAEIYKHEHVAASQEFYGDLLSNYTQWSVGQHLALLAEKLYEGYQQAHEVASREINNYHPNWLGKAAETIFKAEMNLEDMRQAIASQYGFQNWGVVEQKETSYFLPFEEALNALLNGDVMTLKEKLTTYPELIQMKSAYGHQAQLIHYVGNNGVEMWRQQVPLNLADVVKTLLDAGAEKLATMPVYGGQFTAAQLFATSAHPHDAGNRDEVLGLLS